jgi:hypothetical protein
MELEHIGCTAWFALSMIAAEPFVAQISDQELTKIDTIVVIYVDKFDSKLIARRFGLEPLPGVRADMADLTNALSFDSRPEIASKHNEQFEWTLSG